MKASGIFILICIGALSTRANADGRCEKFEDQDYGVSRSLFLKTCIMWSIAIDSKDFSITSDRDERVEGFNARNNRNLKYLPSNLGTKFPSVLGLLAQDCSIREVSKDNFKGLSKLRWLILHGNQIEKIDDDTFEYIPAVEYIYLWENKIKKLNGLAFASLHKLEAVYLENNECINEYFDTATRIAEMPREATGKCGFTESETSPTKIVETEADLTVQSEELQALKLENAMLRIEKAKADIQIAHLNELQVQHNEIKAQLKEICDARIELKVQENSHLSNDLQAKTAEINEKNEKTKQCEKKNQILGGNGP